MCRHLSGDVYCTVTVVSMATSLSLLTSGVPPSASGMTDTHKRRYCTVYTGLLSERTHPELDKHINYFRCTAIGRVWDVKNNEAIAPSVCRMSDSLLRCVIYHSSGLQEMNSTGVSYQYERGSFTWGGLCDRRVKQRDDSEPRGTRGFMCNPFSPEFFLFSGRMRNEVLELKEELLY